MYKMPNRFEYSQSAFALLEQINRQFVLNEPRTFEDVFFSYCFDEYVEKIDRRVAIKQAFSPYWELNLDQPYWGLNEFYDIIDSIMEDNGNVIFWVNVECAQ